MYWNSLGKPHKVHLPNNDHPIELFRASNRARQKQKDVAGHLNVGSMSCFVLDMPFYYKNIYILKQKTLLSH